MTSGCHRACRPARTAGPGAAVHTGLLDTERVGQGCASRVRAFGGHRSQPSPVMAGGPQDYGLATLESWPWPAPWPTCRAPSPASRTRAVLLDDGPARRPNSMNQASGHRAPLSRNRLITRSRAATCMPHCRRPRSAIFYTKVHHRVLRPLMAGDQPQAPPPLRAALRVIDGQVTRRIARPAASSRLTSHGPPFMPTYPAEKSRPMSKSYSQARLGAPQSVKWEACGADGGIRTCVASLAAACTLGRKMGRTRPFALS